MYYTSSDMLMTMLFPPGIWQIHTLHIQESNVMLNDACERQCKLANHNIGQAVSELQLQVEAIELD